MATLEPLTTYLSSSNEDRIVLSFEQIEAIIGGPLIASARLHQAVWSNGESNTYSRFWRRAGFRTSTAGVPTGHIAFDRIGNDFGATSSPTQHQAAGLIDFVGTRPRDDRTADTVLLLGCVKTKGADPALAKDLYISAMFQRRRTYAEASGHNWFILSAKHGLLRPDELVEPYDVYLATQSSAYRAAWGNWVVARLEAELGDLRGLHFEIHASSAYVDSITALLESRGARVARPLEGLAQGEQLAWYDHSHTDAAVPPTHGHGQLVDDALAALADPERTVSPANLGSARLRLDGPGLYSWWVDTAGARELSDGLGEQVAPGLLYAGQAGATRWPSGGISSNTLRDRLVKMHLGGRRRFSTLRRTLGAILGLDDESAITQWMNDHLRVAVWPHADADALSSHEHAVLAALDPPLNLRGMPASAVRGRLSQLRSGGM